MDKKIYTKPEQSAISRVLLEVYKTDDENFKPYVSSGLIQNNSAEDDSEDTEKGFSLHQGEITEIAYSNKFYNVDFEQDYKEMSSNATLKTGEIDKNRYYKGVRCLLKTAWDTQDKILQIDDYDNTVLGFITEQTFSEDGSDIKVTGADILLEQKFIFEFENMKRSEILSEIIKCAGLTPMIDVTGLDDDVINYSNKSESNNTDNNEISTTGSKTIDEAVKNAINGITDDLSKAKAIDKAFKEHIYYNFYSDVQHPDLDEAWNNAHLNCADGANVLCAMFNAGGLNAVIIHVPPELTENYGHYIVKVTINGKDYFTDNAADSGLHTSRPFGEVWLGQTDGDEVGKKIES